MKNLFKFIYKNKKLLKPQQTIYHKQVILEKKGFVIRESGDILTLSDNLPKFIGGYDITGNKGGTYSINFNMVKRPSIFHRKMIKIILGWDWVDANN